MVFLRVLVYMLLCVGCVAIGGYDIKLAIEAFQEKSWFGFGFNIMWVVFWAANIVRIVFKL